MKANINRNNQFFGQFVQFHFQFWRIWSVPSGLRASNPMIKRGLLVWQAWRYLFRVASTVHKLQGFDYFCMDQKLQSYFGFQNKRNILWFKNPLTINSSQLIIYLSICFKLTQINHKSASLKYRKLTNLNAWFHHAIWANPKYLIHVLLLKSILFLLLFTEADNLSRGWIKAVWFF